MINLDELREDVKKYPSDDQYERAKRFGVTQNAIAESLVRAGISYKKKSWIHINTDEEERLKFQKRIKAYEESNQSIIYIDESGFSEYMPRTHGYAKKGQRCFDVSHYIAKPEKIGYRYG